MLKLISLNILVSLYVIPSKYSEEEERLCQLGILLYLLLMFIIFNNFIDSVRHHKSF